MTSHFIPPKLERMAQAMYKENKYVVINGGQKLPPVSSPDMGTAREMQESNTKRNSGEETYSNGFQLLG